MARLIQFVRSYPKIHRIVLSFSFSGEEIKKMRVEIAHLSQHATPQIRLLMSSIVHFETNNLYLSLLSSPFSFLFDLVKQI